MADQFGFDKVNQFSSDKAYKAGLHFLLLTVKADIDHQ